MIEDQTIASVEDVIPARISVRRHLHFDQSASSNLEASAACPSTSNVKPFQTTLHQPFPVGRSPSPVDPVASVTHPSILVGPSPGPSAAPVLTKSPSVSPDESVGSDTIEGFAKVESLASYLVSLRDESRALTHEQASEVIRLWNDLNPYDKRPTKFSPRHRTTQTKGRFKTSKTNVAPGVDSTKRCFLGQNTGPAQWPDCNRYVEAIIIKLCAVFPSPTRSKGVTTMRWTTVTRAYKTIREMVLNNARIMAQTGIQLVEINNTTLNQWFNKRGKKQEREILKQGITLPQPPASTSQPLPSAKTLPAALPAAQQPNPHIFLLPPNTAGQSKVRRRLLPATSAPSAIGYVVQSTSSVPQQNMPSTSQQIVTPPSTTWYRKRKLEKELAGEFSRKYVKKTEVITCKKCGLERKKDTHKQYYGNWFCQLTTTIPYEEWKAGLLAKGYGKKK